MKSLMEGKIFLERHNYVFEGKSIPCQVYISHIGNITTTILVQILNFIDMLSTLIRIMGGPGLQFIDMITNTP